MEDQELLQMMVSEPWERYRRADWRGKLALLRHSFSMYIPYADRGYEFLHTVLDDRAELKYSVNKAAVIGDSHSIKGFTRFVFALGEGETKTFTWVTADGGKEWILSRDRAVLYVDVPEFGEGFFIRFFDFRDECFAAYEKCYGWGFNADIRKIEVPATDYDFLHTLDVQDEFELVRFLDDGQSFETTDAERLLQYINACRDAEEVSDDYEYWYEFDKQNTEKLIAAIHGEDDPETALLREFSGEGGCSKLRSLCDIKDIEYHFSSYV